MFVSCQLVAFEEAGEQLNRSTAACGFRWNNEVRKRYEHEIAHAKEQRKLLREKAKVSSEQASVPVEEEIEETLFRLMYTQINTFLKQLKKIEESFREMKARKKDLEAEIHALKEAAFKAVRLGRGKGSTPLSLF